MKPAITKRQRTCSMISRLALAVPLVFAFFVIGLVVWQLFLGGPHQVLRVYKTQLLFGARIWFVSSILGLLFAARASHLARWSGHDLKYVALHAVSLFLFGLASCTYGMPVGDNVRNQAATANAH